MSNTLLKRVWRCQKFPKQSVGKFKLKLWWNITTFLWEWINTYIYIYAHTIPSVDEDWKQLELSYIAGWNAKLIEPLWKSVWQFLTNWNVHMLYYPVCHSWIFTLEKWKLMSSWKYRHKFYNHSINNCPKLETT